MEDAVMHAELQWILGIIGACAVLGLSIWWRVEARQDKKIDDLREDNGDAHGRLHDKIETMQKEVHQNHTHLLAKFEELWRNIRNGHK